MKYFSFIVLTLWQLLNCATVVAEPRLLLRTNDIEGISSKVTQDFRFTLDHAEPNPAAEAKKDPRLKCPAPLIRSAYYKTANDARGGLAYLHTTTIEVLETIAGDLGKSAPTTADGVPLVTHRVWLTNPDTLHPIPPEHIERYLTSVRKLNALNCGWKHKFWCWERSQIAAETLALFEAEGIEIAEINTNVYLSRFRAMHFVHAAMDHGLYTLAGNILRNNILLREGGLYTDMGAEVVLDPTALLRKSDFVAHLRKGRTDKTAWWIDHDFMAATANNAINRLFLERIHNLHELALKPDVVAFFNNPRMMHCWTNARLLTEIVCLFSEEYRIRTVILPDADSFFSAHHLTSWYGGDGKSCRDIDRTTLNWFRVTPEYTRLKQTLLRDGFNQRNLYKQHFAPHAVTDGEMMHHFMHGSKGLSIEPLSGTQKVIVTLTSWTGKIHNAYLAIRSLLNQSLPPNEIVLWLAEEEFPTKQIPATLDVLEKNKLLTIKWHPRNIKSAKKLIPALMDPSLNQHMLVTADDDIIYKADWLAELVKAHLANPEAIIAHRTRAVQFEESGVLKPYTQWPLQTTKAEADGKLLFPTSGGGMLFPPNSLRPGALDADLFMRLTPTGDDIFWWLHALIQGTIIVLTDTPQTQIIDTNGDAELAVSLWITNQLGPNDTMIKNILRHYQDNKALQAIFKHLITVK